MFVFLFVCANIYLYIRGLQALPAIPLLQILYTVLFIIILGSFITGFYFDDNLPKKIAFTFKLVGRYWIFFLLFFLLAAFIGDLLRALNYLFEIFPLWITQNYSNVKLIYFSSVIISALLISTTGF